MTQKEIIGNHHHKSSIFQKYLRFQTSTRPNVGSWPAPPCRGLTTRHGSGLRQRSPPSQRQRRRRSAALTHLGLWKLGMLTSVHRSDHLWAYTSFYALLPFLLWGRHMESFDWKLNVLLQLLPSKTVIWWQCTGVRFFPCHCDNLIILYRW